MLIGIATLLMLLFGGGQDTFMLNPYLKKQIKTHVGDKDRRSGIDELIKQVKKDQAAFLKERKKTIKALTELNSDYKTTVSQFETLFDEYYDRRVALQNTYLDREMKIRELITEGEWDKIMTSVLEQPDKEKARRRVLEKNEKMYAGLAGTCEKTMTNKDTLAKAKEIIDRHRKVTESFIEEFLDLGYRNLEPIRKYNATRADFELIRKQMSDHHRKYLTSVIELRFDLVSLASEKEWWSIGKELNSAFKKGNKGV